MVITVPEPSPSIAPPSRIQSAFENGKFAFRASRSPISSSPGKSYLPPHPLNSKACARRSLAAAHDDRTSVAKPDISEGLDDHLRERRQRSRGVRGVLVRGYQPHFSPDPRRKPPRQMRRPRVRQISGRRATSPGRWKSNPYRLVGRPFGIGRGLEGLIGAAANRRSGQRQVGPERAQSCPSNRD